ncbi:MAG: MGMT family protein [Candidatus Portnoybacteria bacterium]|nr:MGMT family protein [Candidatus Portnoybacteria bacterium]
MIEFQKRVYNIVKRIPRGKVLSYKQVAAKLGNKKLARAVGNALNKNRDPKVPCHRVIRSDGKIGGYAWGTKKKTKTLKKEGVRIEKDRIIKKSSPTLL